MKIWEQALEIIKEEISPVGYKTYVEVMIPRLTDENTICFLAPSEYHIEVLTKKYLDLISNSLTFLTNKNYIICFQSKEASLTNDEVEEEETILDVSAIENREENKTVTNQSESFAKQTNEKTVQYNSNSSDGLNLKYTFDNYIVGSNNRFAHAAAVAVSENPGTKYNPLYIYGGVGLGKTHLMQAIGHAIKKNNPNINIIYTTGESFTNELVSAIMRDNSDNESFRNKYRKIDVLLIDDIQFLAGKEKCQEEFFHTFNTLFESGKQIILSSEKPPKEINMLEERLKTRFEMGLTVDIQAPDYETRLAILKKKRDNERYVMDDSVLVKIATKVTSNIRELEGVFNKLIAYTSFTNNELTDDIIDNTIESILVKTTNVVTSKLIMQVVSKFFNIKVDDLLSTNRSKNVAYPRQIAMYLCRSVINMTFPQIGRDFGGKDHTTVLHAFNKIEDEYKKDENTKSLIDDIKKSLSTKSLK
ncbi:MAG: chromosomal replication initiator protein DnaA [Clostridia bacterium]|nr:chromosomal replication initiator protein DnaA [Clostridia bacterium]